MFNEKSARKRSTVKCAALVAIGPGLFLVFSIYGPPSQRAAQRLPQARAVKPAQQKKPDYSRFSHDTHVLEKKLSCNSCHSFPSKNWKEVRKGNEAFPDVTEYPEHQSCLNCHRKQFFARERPVPRICSNCHVKATPQETSRHPFPSLGDRFLSLARAIDFVSDFRVYFPHDKHVDVITKRTPAEPRVFVRVSFGSVMPREDSDPKSCSICHQTYQPQGKSDDEFVTKPPKNIGDSFWLKKGTFKTRPISHAACFSCHNQESELAPLPQSCHACHKGASITPVADFDPALFKKMEIGDWWTLTAARDRFSSGTFRHEVHSELSCTKCHNVAMNTVDLKTLKVPIKSCGGAEGCHVTTTTDEGGILNYEIDQRKTNQNFVCVKCHIAFGAKPTPAGHIETIPKQVAK